MKFIGLVTILFLFFNNGICQEGLEKSKRRHHLSQLIYDTQNEDGVILAQKAKTQKWGLVQEMGNRYAIIVPFSYDSIAPPGYNAEFVFVYNGGRIGVYLLSWTVGEENARESVPCDYDRLLKTEIKGCTYLAGQRNGRWVWLDWYTGSEKGEYSASFRDLPSPECSWRSEFYGETGCPGCIQLN